jgi:hypothetical protein
MDFSSSSRCIRSALIVGLLAVGLASNGYPQSQDVVLSTDSPLMKVGLSRYGDPSGGVGGRQKWSLAFVGNNKIVLGWATLDDADAAIKKGRVIPAPAHLHAVILDTRTGQTSKVQDWAVSTLEASIARSRMAIFYCIQGRLFVYFRKILI